MIQTAKGTLRKMIKGQKGQALPIVLVLLVIGGLLIVPTLRYASTSLKGHQVTETKVMELYAADSGVEDALHWVIKGKETGVYSVVSWDTEDPERPVAWERDPHYEINSGRDVGVTVERLDAMGPNYYKITSTAATSPSGGTTVLSTVWAAPEPLEGFGDLGPGDTWEGDAYVEGGGDLFGNITGNVYVTGDLTLKSSQSSIGGNVYVGGNFELKSQSSVVHGNVCCAGNITIKEASAIVEGDIYMTVDGSQTIDIKGTTGDIYVEGSGTVTISLYPQASVGTIYIHHDVTLVKGKWKGECEPIDDDCVDDQWDGVNPPPPECPDIPIGGGDIQTYEIT